MPLAAVIELYFRLIYNDTDWRTKDVHNQKLVGSTESWRIVRENILDNVSNLNLKVNQAKQRKAVRMGGNSGQRTGMPKTTPEGSEDDPNAGQQTMATTGGSRVV